MILNDVVLKVKSLHLPKNSYVVFGSGPLAAAGIREVNDIDLLVSPEIYKKLKKEGWKVLHKGPKDTPVTFDVFEAHENWDFCSYSPTLEQLLANATEVDGVKFASLQDVRKWKANSPGPKHPKDLKLIKKYLSNVQLI